MVRGLDGFLILVIPAVALCSFEGPGRLVSRLFPVALARGKHLFPFRTEQLSLSAPMVLGSQGPGRVGRRRFFLTHEPPAGRLVALGYAIRWMLRTSLVALRVRGELGVVARPGVVVGAARFRARVIE